MVISQDPGLTQRHLGQDSSSTQRQHKHLYRYLFYVLVCGRKPEHQEKTHECTGRWCKLLTDQLQAGRRHPTTVLWKRTQPYNRTGDLVSFLHNTWSTNKPSSIQQRPTAPAENWSGLTESLCSRPAPGVLLMYSSPAFLTSAIEFLHRGALTNSSAQQTAAGTEGH